jgi:opacity protein-like surface antigen
VAGGLQLEPRIEKQFAPFGYVTVGLYHSSASAEVLDMRDGSAQMSDSWSDNAFGVAAGGGLRVRLGGPWTARVELRYSGFSWKPGTVNWASIVTPGVNLSVAF